MIDKNRKEKIMEAKASHRIFATFKADDPHTMKPLIEKRDD